MSAAGELTERFLRDEAALRRRQAEANRIIAASGAAHLIHAATAEGGPAANGPWSLDPIPLILDGDVFDRLAAAVRERVEALEMLLGDLYGPRQVVRDAVVPAEALAASPRYRLADVGVPPPPRWLVSYAVDVIADPTGTWRIVQDLTDTPTGIGYALLDRSVMAGVAAELLGPSGAGDLASISAFPAELRRALAAVTTVPSPRIVLYSEGVDDPAYVEHSALARLLGFHLVESPDLVVRTRRLWLRTLGGLDPIDVVYRRTADSAVDPIEVSATGTAGVPGLLYTTAEAGVVLANAHGSGVLEDPALAGFWPAAIAALTGSRLALDQLDGAGDDGSPPFAAVPTLRGGRADTASVVVRLHAVHGPDGVVVMAGGNGRVLAHGDDPRRPTARLAKDVWVLGAERAAAVVTAPPLPQVDLASSVPTRAADSLFWVGRSAERAEALARTARVVAARRQQDPGLASLDSGRWAYRMAGVLRGLSGRAGNGAPVDPWPIVALDAELAAAGRAVGEQLGQLVAGAATVAEYLSSASGRVLESLAEWRDEFADGGAPIDGLDAVLADLAAFAGLWSESTVRGPAWRFGDIGRRVERALMVLELLELCLGDAPSTIDRDDAVDLSALEVLLAANDSLVAYRRRHRSDVELVAALALLLRDQDNPRSFGASVRQLAEHATAVHWSQGTADASRLARMVDGSAPDIRRAYEATTAFAALVVDSWFATPVNPTLVRARLRRGARTA